MLGSARAEALSYLAVVTVPKRYRWVDGQTDGWTDDVQSHNRALRGCENGVCTINIYVLLAYLLL